MKKTFLMLMLMLVSFAMQAQTKFHDVEANEATGPVKSMAISAMGQVQTYTFSPEGKMEVQGMSDAVYDADGYLQSAKMEVQGMKMEIHYKWENGKCMGTSMTVMGQQMSTSRTFGEKGEVTSEKINMGGQEMSSSYTDYVFDDHGNWTSRKTSIMGQEMVQTRTIEYYQ